MALKWNPERCCEFLQKSAETDSFLSARDQFPDFLQRLDNLNSAFESFLRKQQERCEERRVQLEKHIQQAEKLLSDAREKIDRLFDSRDSDLLELSEMISRLSADLYWPLQVQLLRDLEVLSSKGRLVDLVLGDLRRLYESRKDEWPNQVRVLFRRGNGESLHGKSIWEVKREEVLGRLCGQSSFSFVCRGRFFLIRALFRFEFRTVLVLLQELYREYFCSQATDLSAPFLEKQTEEYTELSSYVEGRWKSIRFGLEVTAAELQELGSSGRESAGERVSELRQLAIDALTRNAETLPEVQTRFSEFWREFLGELQKQHQSRVEELRRAVRRSGTLRGSWHWTLRNLKGSLSHAFDRVRGLLGKIVRFGTRHVYRVYLEGEDLTVEAASWLGIASPTRQKLLALADLPRFEHLDEKLRQFPPIYRRLFSNQALDSQEFLVRRDQELQQLRDAIGRFKEGRRANVVITGQMGTGKTSLIQSFLNHEIGRELQAKTLTMSERLLSEKDFLKLFSQLTGHRRPAPSIEALIDRLTQMPKQIIVVEQAHHLILRIIGGRVGIERFQRLMAATRDHVMWVLTLREYPFKLMDHQVSLSQFFTHEVETLFQSVDELKEAIILRHRNSGYNLLYGVEGASSRRLRKLRARFDDMSEEVQKALESEYFENLYEITGGNMFAAIYFWLISAEYVSEGQYVKVSACSKPDVSLIKSFDTQTQYTLAELLYHGEMTVDEHSAVFLVSETRSRTILDHLSYLRLLNSEGRQGKVVYSINPVLVNPIIEILNSVNVIY